MKDRIEELERALKELIEDGLWASEQIGIHPASWVDLGDPTAGYEKRTPEMEEHNDRAMAFLKRLIAAKKLLDGK